MWTRDTLAAKQQSIFPDNIHNVRSFTALMVLMGKKCRQAQHFTAFLLGCSTCHGKFLRGVGSTLTIESRLAEHPPCVKTHMQHIQWSARSTKNTKFQIVHLENVFSKLEYTFAVGATTCSFLDIYSYLLQKKCKATKFKKPKWRLLWRFSDHVGSYSLPRNCIHTSQYGSRSARVAAMIQ
jgi:hypothetical protein